MHEFTESQMDEVVAIEMRRGEWMSVVSALRQSILRKEAADQRRAGVYPVEARRTRWRAIYRRLATAVGTTLSLDERYPSSADVDSGARHVG